MTNITNILSSHPRILTFLLVNLIIGLWANVKSRTHNFEDYALARRQLPAAILVITLLGTLVDISFLSHPDHTYTYGNLQIVKLITILLTYLFIGLFIASPLIHFKDAVTLGDVMYNLYGRIGRIYAGIIGLLFSLVVIATQLKAISALSYLMLGISPTYALFLFGGIVILYSILGGMSAISYTHVFQILAAFLAFTLFLGALLTEIGGIEVLWKRLQQSHPAKMDLNNYTLLWQKIKSESFWTLSLAWILTPPVIQRMLVVKDTNKVRKMWYTSAAFTGLLVIICMCIGFVAIAYSNTFGLVKNPQGILLSLVQKMFAKKPLVMELLFLGFISLGISTMDAYLHAIGLSFVQDILNPIKQMVVGQPIIAEHKRMYAKIGIFILGLLSLALGMAYTELEKFYLSGGIIYAYATVIIPLVIGIFGFKTDNVSWGFFLFTYLCSIGSLYMRGWDMYNTFVVSLSVGTLAYFLIHIYKYKGFMLVNRQKEAVAEKLWTPKLGDIGQIFQRPVKNLINLGDKAHKEVTQGNPTQSLGFSIMMFGFYVLASIVLAKKRQDFILFMGLLRAIGITLCCGLMLEGLWPARWKKYFSLYWLLTLFYCLPFASTLVFIRMHLGITSILFFVGSFVLLSLFVSSNVFTWMTFGSIFAGHSCWYVIMKSWPPGLWRDGIYLTGWSVVTLLLIAVTAFTSHRERLNLAPSIHNPHTARDTLANNTDKLPIQSPSFPPIKVQENQVPVETQEATKELKEKVDIPKDEPVADEKEITT